MIQLEHVSKAFSEGIPALNDVSLHISEGDGCVWEEQRCYEYIDLFYFDVSCLCCQLCYAAQECACGCVMSVLLLWISRCHAAVCGFYHFPAADRTFYAAGLRVGGMGRRRAVSDCCDVGAWLV